MKKIETEIICKALKLSDKERFALGISIISRLIYFLPEKYQQQLIDDFINILRKLSNSETNN